MSHSQYFERYAEPEVHQLQHFPSRYYDQVLCIPACDESTDFVYSVANAAKNYKGEVLFILIVNQTEKNDTIAQNDELVRFLQQHPLIWENTDATQTVIKLIDFAVMDILLIDRFSAGKQIPKQQWVGLARKIACDCAAFLFHQGQIKAPQLFCSDADVIFPDTYFYTQLDTHCSAALFPFKHIPNDNAAITKATEIYEQSLYHYVNGLKKAGSPYAFHTIGSCLLLNMDYYVKARGFPKKSGAEDFYLLNKLQKLAEVKTLESPVLLIESRLSNRVPFGTGPAIAKLLTGDALDSPIFYHPACFDILQLWLEYLAGKTHSPDFIFNPISALEKQYIDELANVFELEACLDNAYKQYKTEESRQRHIHQWFDGFKTLKTVHYLRDKHFPSVSYRTLAKAVV